MSEKLVGETRTGWMDLIDFQEEVGNALGGNKVYPDLEDLKRQKPCTAECGIVKVEVKCVEVVQDYVTFDKRDHTKYKTPLPFVSKGQTWVHMPQRRLFTVAEVDGETVVFNDGSTTPTRDLNNGQWGQVHVRKARGAIPSVG